MILHVVLKMFQWRLLLVLDIDSLLPPLKQRSLARWGFAPGLAAAAALCCRILFYRDFPLAGDIIRALAGRQLEGRNLRSRIVIVNGRSECRRF